MRDKDTFTSYRGYGFWSSNLLVQTWLCILVEHIGRLNDCPDWLAEVRDHWLEEAAEAPWEAVVSPDLDGYFSDNKRREFLLQLSLFALAQLRKMGPAIPVEYLKSIGAEPKNTMILKPLPSKAFVTYAEKWVALLTGDPGLTSSNAPDRIMVDPRKRN